jgi:ferredoxin
MGALLASENPHALDLAAARMIGLGPRDVPTLEAAVRRGLIPEHYEALDICGCFEKFFTPDFKTIPVRDVTRWGTDNDFVASVLRRLFASYPRVDAGQCIGCKKCGAHCPAGAIAFVNGRPRIDRRACVRCFCCQEFCPAGAVTVCRPPAARLLSR